MYTEDPRCGNAAPIPTDILVQNLHQLPTTPAGRWLSRHHAVAPALADTIAALAGLIVSEAR